MKVTERRRRGLYDGAKGQVTRWHKVDKEKVSLQKEEEEVNNDCSEGNKTISKDLHERKVRNEEERGFHFYTSSQHDSLPQKAEKKNKEKRERRRR